MSTRERLASYKPTVLEVPMPEMDAVFHVRQLRASDQLRWSAAVKHAYAELGEGDPLIDQIAALLEMTLCEPDGTLVYPEQGFSWADLGDMPWDLAQRLYVTAMEVNGMRAEDQASAEGNSEPTPTEGLHIA